jgi:ferrous iron transport protein B
MRIAFAGNPNSGKTTMFNALTGRNEKVGNWAGVTVDKKEHPIKKTYAGSHQLIAVLINLILNGRIIASAQNHH